MKTPLEALPRWQGDVDKDLLRKVVTGLLVPSVELSRRLAWMLLIGEEPK